MPCNLYGPNDNYNSTGSHFFSALIKKAVDVKKYKKKKLYYGEVEKPKEN
jgi:GDP-L-fucose synthase